MRLFLLAFLPVAALATEPKPVQAPTQSQGQIQSQFQEQSQSQEQSAANVLTIKDRLQIPATPAPTAPAIYASNPCALGESSATTLPVFGRAKGKSTVDPGCEFRELVRVTASVDRCLALQLLMTHPQLKDFPTPVCASESALVALEQRLTDKIGTAFKQSQSK